MDLRAFFKEHSTAAVMSAVALPLVVWLSWMQWRAHLLADARVPSQCTITASGGGASDDAPSDYSFSVSFHHQVDGVRYEGSDTKSTLTSSDVSHLELSHGVGKTVPCLYVAGRPDLVLIWPTDINVGALMIIAVALVVPFIMFVHSINRSRSAAGRKSRRKRAKATRLDGPQTDGHAMWREATRQVADDLGLRHLPQQQLFDQVDGWVDPFEVRITDGLTRVRQTSATWPVFRRRDGAKHDAPPAGTGDAAFEREVSAHGLTAAHRQGLKDPRARSLIRRVVVELGVECTAKGLSLRHKLLLPSAEAIRASLDPMLELAAWLEEPNAPIGQAKLGKAPLEHIGDASDADKRDQLRAWLASFGPRVGPGKVVAKQDSLEWRSKLEELPFRIRIDEFDDVQLQLKVGCGLGDIHLSYDPAAIPEADADDAWDEDDRISVFVGRGVYFQGESAEVDAQLARWESLPESTRDALVSAMREANVGWLRVGKSTLELEMRTHLTEMRDPEGQLMQAVELLSRLGTELPELIGEAHGAVTPTVSSATTAHRERIKCSYCRALFVWTTHAECPNCGANTQA